MHHVLLTIATVFELRWLFVSPGLSCKSDLTWYLMSQSIGLQDCCSDFPAVSISQRHFLRSTKQVVLILTKIINNTYMWTYTKHRYICIHTALLAWSNDEQSKQSKHQNVTTSHAMAQFGWSSNQFAARRLGPFLWGFKAKTHKVTLEAPACLVVYWSYLELLELRWEPTQVVDLPLGWRQFLVGGSLLVAIPIMRLQRICFIG